MRARREPNRLQKAVALVLAVTLTAALVGAVILVTLWIWLSIAEMLS